MAERSALSTRKTLEKWPADWMQRAGFSRAESERRALVGWRPGEDSPVGGASVLGGER